MFSVCYGKLESFDQSTEGLISQARRSSAEVIFGFRRHNFSIPTR
jgi:hypothetical protein